MSNDFQSRSSEVSERIISEEPFDPRKFLANSVIEGEVRRASGALVASAHDRIVQATMEDYEDAKSTFRTTEDAQAFISTKVRDLVDQAPPEERIKRQAA